MAPEEGGTIDCEGRGRFLTLFWCGFAFFGKNIFSFLRSAVLGKKSGKSQCGFRQNLLVLLQFLAKFSAVLRFS